MMSRLPALWQRTRSAWASLFIERAPFFVSAFFGAVAWSFAHVADRLSEAPIVSYSATYKSIPDPHNGEYVRTTMRIENLSRSKSHSATVFILRRADESVDTLFLIQPRMIDLRAVPPASAAGSGFDVDVDAAQFTLASIPPLSQFDLIAHYRGKDKPVLVGDPNSEMKFVLIDSSWQTIVLKYELALIWIALGIWCASIVLWAYLHQRDEPDGTRKRWRGTE